MAHRYFTTDINGDTANITGPDAAHLAKVLRVRPGEKLVLCNGSGVDFVAEVTKVSPQEVILRVLGSSPALTEPDIWVEMYIGYAKGDRLEWAIQKSVELGASVIVPFFSANTVVKPKKEEEKNLRYTRIAHEAAKQCGRGILPKVEMPLNYTEMLEAAGKNQRALFLYEGGGEPLRKVLEGQTSIAIITGAEGGFTPQEAQQAAEGGCVQVGLGARILRCETAPVAALAAVMALSGNLE